MDSHDIIALILTLTAVCSYVNYRYLQLTPSIGVTIIAMIFTLGIKFFSSFDPEVLTFSEFLTSKIEFEKRLINNVPTTGRMPGITRRSRNQIRKLQLRM